MDSPKPQSTHRDDQPRNKPSELPDPPIPTSPKPGQGKRSAGWLLVFAACGLIIGLLASRSPLSYFIPPDKASVDFQTMRTFAVITIPAGSGATGNVEEIAQLAKAAVMKVDELMSPVGEKSDVHRLNNTPADQWVDVHPLTWKVVMEALRWHRLSNGAFDPTIGPIKALFKFNKDEAVSWPDAKTLAEARSRVGAEKLHYDREGMRLLWAVDHMRLDLGAIAKGFAADEAARVLLSYGVKNALVNIGGELRTLGKKPGSPPIPWRAGIQHPRRDDMEEKLELENAAVATSGDYENYFTYQGKRYEHIIDPKSGLPISSGPASVTVIHPNSCLAADALATTLCVLGPENGKVFLERQAVGLFSAGIRVIMLLPDPNLEAGGKRIEFVINKDTKGKLIVKESRY